MKARRRSPYLVVLTTTAALAITGCSSPGQDTEQVPSKSSIEGSTAPASSTPPVSTAPSSMTPSASETSASSTQGVDTSDWKEFNFQNLSFRYPKSWVVSSTDCQDCDPDKSSPYTQWDVITDHGFIVAKFSANDASDTDGNMNSYERTVLEREKHAGKFSTPTVLMAERYVSVAPGDGADVDERFVMFVGDEKRADDRGSLPDLSVFYPAKEQYAVFESTQQLPEAVGIDPEDVDEEAAALILASPEYQQLKAVMLSLRTPKSVGGK